MMKKVLLSLCVAAGFVAALPAQAQVFAKPEDAIRYRQSAYVLMGNHMGRINAQLKADKPDLAAIQRSAAIIDFASQLPGEGYIAGSESGGTPPTRAKPEVFKDPKVKEIGMKMREEVVKLNAAAKSGDIAAIRAQFGETGKSCKACHDNYRKD
jgi:cytochrome c556